MTGHVRCLPTSFAVGLLSAVVAASQPAGQANQPNPSHGRTVTVGSYTVVVPSDWRPFGAGEAAELRRQYLAQSQEISRQFSGSADTAGTVDVAAFHVGDDTGSFVMVVFTVPPGANLIGLLKGQVDDKMAFGVREGYIRKYLGLVPIDNERFSGFYTKAIGRTGAIEVSGGLEHRKLRNTVIQLTLLGPAGWDETRATTTLATILDSVQLRAISPSPDTQTPAAVVSAPPPPPAVPVTSSTADLRVGYVGLQRLIDETAAGRAAKARIEEARARGRGAEAAEEERIRFESMVVPLLRTIRARFGLGIVFARDESGIVWSDLTLDLTEALKPLIDAVPAEAETRVVPPVGRLGVVNVQKLADDSRLGKEFKARVAANGLEQGAAQAEFQRRVAPVAANLGRETGLRLLLSAADSGIVWMDPALDATAAMVARLDIATHGQAAAPSSWSPPTAAVAYVGLQELADESRLGRESSAAVTALAQKAGTPQAQLVELQSKLQDEFRGVVGPLAERECRARGVSLLLAKRGSAILDADGALDLTGALVKALDSRPDVAPPPAASGCTATPEPAPTPAAPARTVTPDPAPAPSGAVRQDQLEKSILAGDWKVVAANSIDSPVAHFCRAVANGVLGEWRSMEDAGRKARGDRGQIDRFCLDLVTRHPDNPHVLFLVATNDYDNGDREKAVARYRRVVETAPGTAWAYYQLGIHYGKQGRWSDQIAWLDKAVQADAQYSPAYSGRGAAYKEMGRLDLAAAEFKRGVEVLEARNITSGDQFGRAAYNWGWILVNRPVPDNEGAIAVLSKAIKADPKRLEAYNELGIAYKRLGRFADAIRTYRACIANGGGDAALYFNLGVSEYRNNNMTEARAAFEKAVSLDPAGQTGATARQWLGRIRGARLAEKGQWQGE
jgi:tetratricopeptide (TPR) repeat protein